MIKDKDRTGNYTEIIGDRETRTYANGHLIGNYCSPRDQVFDPNTGRYMEREEFNKKYNVEQQNKDIAVMINKGTEKLISDERDENLRRIAEAICK